VASITLGSPFENSASALQSTISAMFMPHWHMATKIRISSFSVTISSLVSTIAYHSYFFFSNPPKFF
jgi:hypothetical protein